MSRWSHVARSLRSQPGFTLMRAVARFAWVRHAMGFARSMLHRRRLQSYLAGCEARMAQSMFGSIDRTEFVRRLRSDGVAFGLALPPELTAELVAYAARNPCFADRQPTCGFRFGDRLAAEAALGKPILVAQFFNVAQSPAVARLMGDPALQWIAAKYLESIPTFVGSNLWWTFPVQALEEDRDRHAHLFHRDVDDFRFFKFFFYLTDVESGDGAHVCVVASHRRPLVLRAGDRWNIRRYTDAEIEQCFDASQIVEICGPAGSGFAENTLCVHKGLTPTRAPRLLLQLQYALFDYGVAHDRRDPAALAMVA